MCLCEMLWQPEPVCAVLGHVASYKEEGSVCALLAHYIIAVSAIWLSFLNKGLEIRVSLGTKQIMKESSALWNCKKLVPVFDAFDV